MVAIGGVPAGELTDGLRHGTYPTSTGLQIPWGPPAVKIGPCRGPMLGVVTDMGVLLAGRTTPDSLIL